MAYYLLKREGTVFEGFMTAPEKKQIFRVRGADAAKAAIRFMGIVTPIQNYFFDNPHGSHGYNVSDELTSPYLGLNANDGYYGGDKERDYWRPVPKEM